MTRKNGLRAGVLAVLGVALAMPVAHVAKADDISTVEGARAKERQGGYVTRLEREQLRRYGGNDDGYNSRRYGYGSHGGPGVSVYVGPRPYYGPYGY